MAEQFLAYSVNKKLPVISVLNYFVNKTLKLFLGCVIRVCAVVTLVKKKQPKTRKTFKIFLPLVATSLNFLTYKAISIGNLFYKAKTNEKSNL